MAGKGKGKDGRKDGKGKDGKGKDGKGKGRSAGIHPGKSFSIGNAAALCNLT